MKCSFPHICFLSWLGGRVSPLAPQCFTQIILSPFYVAVPLFILHYCYFFIHSYWWKTLESNFQLLPSLRVALTSKWKTHSLGFLISSSPVAITSNGWSTSWIHSGSYHQVDLVHHWNPKFKLSYQLSHSIFSSNEDFKSVDPSIFSLSIISLLSSLFFPTPVHKTQFITLITRCLIFFLTKLTGTFPLQQLAFPFLHFWVLLRKKKITQLWFYSKPKVVNFHKALKIVL